MSHINVIDLHDENCNSANKKIGLFWIFAGYSCTRATVGPAWVREGLPQESWWTLAPTGETETGDGHVCHSTRAEGSAENHLRLLTGGRSVLRVNPKNEKCLLRSLIKDRLYVTHTRRGLVIKGTSQESQESRDEEDLNGRERSSKDYEKRGYYVHEKRCVKIYDETMKRSREEMSTKKRCEGRRKHREKVAGKIGNGLILDRGNVGGF